MSDPEKLRKARAVEVNRTRAGAPTDIPVLYQQGGDRRPIDQQPTRMYHGMPVVVDPRSGALQRDARALRGQPGHVPGVVPDPATATPRELEMAQRRLQPSLLERWVEGTRDNPMLMAVPNTVFGGLPGAVTNMAIAANPRPAVVDTGPRQVAVPMEYRDPTPPFNPGHLNEMAAAVRDGTIRLDEARGRLIDAGVPPTLLERFTQQMRDEGER